MSKQRVWRSGKIYKLEKNTRVVWAGCNCTKTIRTIMWFDYNIMGKQLRVVPKNMGNGVWRHVISHEHNL